MGMFSQLAQGVDWSSMGAMALRIVAVLLCWWSMRSAMAGGLLAGDPPRSRVTGCPSIPFTIWTPLACS